jgi:hypothetical protein
MLSFLALILHSLISGGRPPTKTFLEKMGDTKPLLSVDFWLVTGLA